MLSKDVDVDPAIVRVGPRARARFLLPFPPTRGHRA